MCGIIGHLALKSDAHLPLETLERLNDFMTHRGPNSAGSFKDGPLSFAMRRLAVVDLILGDQPITSPDGRYTIIFNGEIYNHEEIRRELISRGHLFRTRSDTEVLLHAFMEAGADCLKTLNGMFAFAIWDRDKRELFLARDRMGVKPLYYATAGGHFMFASELTPIRASGLFESRVDLRSVADLLAYWYICEPKTILEGVKQLPPAHYMVVSLRGTSTVRWWQVPAGGERTVSFGEAQEELSSLLRDSVRLRLKSDVPTGILLSGGIDSGLVASFAREFTPDIKCFGIGFKEKSYSELDLAHATATHIQADIVTETMDDVDAALIDSILGTIDEPLGNASLIPSYLLFRHASRHVTVALTGDGGDELFGGYPTYQAPYFRRLFHMLPKPARRAVTSLIHRLPVSHARISLDYRLKQFVDGVSLPPERAHASWREVLNVEKQRPLLTPHVRQGLGSYDPYVNFAEAFVVAQGLSEQNRLMYADQHTYLLNDHLRKIDRASMAHSVEAREPLLDYRIVEFAMHLPAEHKVSFRSTKRILREIARSRLPAAVVAGSKKGLTPPIPAWISADLAGYVREQLQGGVVGQLFQGEAVATMLADHTAHRVDNSRLLWALLSLQVWARRAGVSL